MLAQVLAPSARNNGEASEALKGHKVVVACHANDWVVSPNLTPNMYSGLYFELLISCKGKPVFIEML